MCTELSVYIQAQPRRMKQGGCVRAGFACGVGVQAAGSSGSRWQRSRLTLTLTQLGQAAPGSGQGMPELVRTCTGASADAGAGKGSWDSVRCKRGSHVVAKARRRRGVGRRWRAARWALRRTLRTWTAYDVFEAVRWCTLCLSRTCNLRHSLHVLCN